MPRRIRIHVAYDGTAFHGWQVQPGLRTIQGELEDVVADIEKRPVHVAGSGRTDAGVHAAAQVAAFTLENPRPLPKLRKAMNRLLPPAIRVLTTEEAHEEFHPRFDACSKTYEYRLFRAEVCPPFAWRYMHHYPYPLDERRMVELAPRLEGEHDFSAFAAGDDRYEEGRNMVRRIFLSRLERDGDELRYRVRGSGFLKYMVRNIVGMLLEVGRGNIGEAGLEAMLRNERHAPSTAPAKGLTLIEVEYRI